MTSTGRRKTQVNEPSAPDAPSAPVRPFQGWRQLDVDTALLRTFYVLASTRSFTRTAERVGSTNGGNVP